MNRTISFNINRDSNGNIIVECSEPIVHRPAAQVKEENPIENADSDDQVNDEEDSDDDYSDDVEELEEMSSEEEAELEEEEEEEIEEEEEEEKKPKSSQRSKGKDKSSKKVRRIDIEREFSRMVPVEVDKKDEYLNLDQACDYRDTEAGLMHYRVIPGLMDIDDCKIWCKLFFEDRCNLEYLDHMDKENSKKIARLLHFGQKIENKEYEDEVAEKRFSYYMQVLNDYNHENGFYFFNKEGNVSVYDDPYDENRSHLSNDTLLNAPRRDLISRRERTRMWLKDIK